MKSTDFTSNEIIRCLKKLDKDVGSLSTKIDKLSEDIHKSEIAYTKLESRVTVLEERQEDVRKRLNNIEDDDLLSAREDIQSMTKSTMQKYNWIIIILIAFFNILFTYLY